MVKGDLFTDGGYDNGALLSGCGRYRYCLWRQWGSDRGNYCNFIMLNPSTADAEVDDPTVTRCIRRAKKMGYSGLYVTNLFGLRGTDPACLRGCVDPVGPENDGWIGTTARQSKTVICAWGNGGLWMGRSAAVKKLLCGIQLHALKISSMGEPGHPLYISYGTVPEVW